jgi:hypothetical protein
MEYFVVISKYQIALIRVNHYEYKELKSATLSAISTSNMKQVLVNIQISNSQWFANALQKDLFKL